MRGEAKVAARIGLDAHWHFVAATYHGETMQLYIDARREGYWADYPISTIATRLFVGYKADNDQFIMGASCAVDSVRLFNRALSPWEIEALYYLGQ